MGISKDLRVSLSGTRDKSQSSFWLYSRGSYLRSRNKAVAWDRSPALVLVLSLSSGVRLGLWLGSNVTSLDSFSFSLEHLYIVSWWLSSLWGFYSDLLFNKSQRQHFWIWVFQTCLWNCSVMLFEYSELLTGRLLDTCTPALDGHGVLAWGGAVFLLSACCVPDHRTLETWWGAGFFSVE